MLYANSTRAAWLLVSYLHGFEENFKRISLLRINPLTVVIPQA